MAKIFITRQLDLNSPLLEYALVNGHEVVGRSIIHISRVKVKDIPNTPWVFFYSKNGVSHFVDQLGEEEFKRVKVCKFGAIGKKTAAIVQKSIGKSCDFVANAEQTNIADFMNMIGVDKCLFPRAKQSKKSVEKLLPEDQVEILIVYENVVDSYAVIEGDAEIVIFTSPMNVDSYLLQAKIKTNQRLISIGHTTYDYLKSLGFKSQKAYDPSEDGVVSLLKDILG